MVPYLQRYNLLVGKEQVPDFQRITPSDYCQAFQEAKLVFQEEFARLLTQDGLPTYENTILPYLQAMDKVENVIAQLTSHTVVAITPEMEEMDKRMTGELITLEADVLQNPVFYEAFKAVAAGSETLSPERQRILAKLGDQFEDLGVGLAPDQQAQLKHIDLQLNDLTKMGFGVTLREATMAASVHIQTIQELEGLEDVRIEGCRQQAKEAGYESGYLIVPTDRTVVEGLLQKCACRTTREALYLAQNTIGTVAPHVTEPAIHQIAALRAERAQILGYKSHADYVLRNRMIGSLENLNTFLDAVTDHLLPHYQNEVALVTEYANEKGHDGELKAWDVDYWTGQYKQEKFGIDVQALEPYLQIPTILEGILGHISNLYGLRYDPAADVPVPHKDVSAYRVYDTQTGELRGIFMADLFKRDGQKIGGAWECAYRTVNDTVSPSIPCIVGIHMNLAPGVSTISLGDLATLIHEKGHATHDLLGQGYEANIIRGTNVQRDFVELPSQVLENFIGDTAFMHGFLRHHETGEPCPLELLKRIKEYNTFSAARDRLKVVQNCQYDLAMHTDPARRHGTLAEIEARETIDADISPLVIPYPLTRFPHLWSSGTGYSAGYYAYLWASVLDAQAYASFAELGDKHAGQILKGVLAAGGSVEANELFTGAYGPIDIKHMLRACGVQTKGAEGRVNAPALRPG
ncbi:MAG: M3 family metallopeptidase [Pseudomonadota bacterium]